MATPNPYKDFDESLAHFRAKRAGCEPVKSFRELTKQLVDAAETLLKSQGSSMLTNEQLHDACKECAISAYRAAMTITQYTRQGDLPCAKEASEVFVAAYLYAYKTIGAETAGVRPAP